MAHAARSTAKACSCGRLRGVDPGSPFRQMGVSRCVPSQPLTRTLHQPSPTPMLGSPPASRSGSYDHRACLSKPAGLT